MYKNASIYAIRSHQTDDIYIGSTCNDIKTRFRSHKGAYKSWLKGAYAYYASFELLQYDDAYVELIEKYPCNDKRELEKREGEIIRETENCINKVVAGRTRKEYYNYHKENNTKIYQKILQQTREYKKKRYDNQTDEEKKEYYEEHKDIILKKAKEKYKNNYSNIIKKIKEYQEENKEKIKEYQKKYHKKNREKAKEYEQRPEVKERRKEYREKNKEERNQKLRKYYQENKEKIKEKRKEKITCICGAVGRKADIKKHERSKKHIAYISQNNNPV